MSTQLDPVTGAPLLTPDLGSLDQLPYKVQPVPLADQTNQPQLGRAYLYPDDVPPVLANINAMNGNQQDQAQTLHTDGNHALKVAVSGGGGGGGGPTPAKQRTVGFDVFMSDHAGAHIFPAAFTLGAVLYGFVVQLLVQEVPTGTPNGSTATVDIVNANTGTAFSLMPCTLNAMNTSANPQLILPVFFPVPMDLTVDGGVAGDPYDLYLEAQSTAGDNFSIRLYTSV